MYGNVLNKCSNTEIVVFPYIDRDPKLKPNPIKLVHIKRQHRFDYEKGQCRRSELSETTEKKLFSIRLSLDIFTNFAQSMPARSAAVIEAKGDAIKY